MREHCLDNNVSDVTRLMRSNRKIDIAVNSEEEAGGTNRRRSVSWTAASVNCVEGN